MTLRELLQTGTIKPHACVDQTYPRCPLCGHEVILRTENGVRELRCYRCRWKKVATDAEARPYLDTCG